ncbi:MAG: hypothetical protein GEU98_23830 [Pseudonocardiaceae bacterium]|nr:hypothetical protein [Pseudonocardiaceae bacterium]
MTWQEELRKLDEELAAGRIAADDYRVRRDQVLSSAVAPGEQGQQPASEEPAQPARTPAPQQAPTDAQAGTPPGNQQETTPHQTPAQAPQQQAPQPDAQQPEQAQSGPHGGQNPESTQIISVVPGVSSNPQAPAQAPPDGPTERTQAVTGWQGSDAERTQAVPTTHNPAQQPPYAPPGQVPGSPAGGFPAPPGSPPAGFPAQGQQGQFPQGPVQQGFEPQAPWHVAEDDSPPWGGDFPPLHPGSTSDWVKQGPEVFDQDSQPKKKSKTMFAVFGVVLLVAVAGVAVWFFVLRGDGGGGQAGGGGEPGQSQQNEPPKPLDQAVPDPPGQSDDSSGRIAVRQANQNGLLNAEEVSALGDAGVRNLVFKGSQDNDFTYEAMAFETSGQQAATQLVDDLYSAARNSGMQDGARGGLPASAKVTQRSEFPDKGAYRAVYAAGDRVIRVVVAQEPIGKDDKKLIAQFQQYAVSVSENVSP